MGLALIAAGRPAAVDARSPSRSSSAWSLTIMLHEWGHYIAAKKSGMKVTEFFLGFGPRIWSFRRGETEYGIKAIPAGGYVRIIGMTQPRGGRPRRRSQDVPPGDDGQATHHGPRRHHRQPGHRVGADLRDPRVPRTGGRIDADRPGGRRDRPRPRPGCAPVTEIVAIDGERITDWDAGRADRSARTKASRSRSWWNATVGPVDRRARRRQSIDGAPRVGIAGTVVERPGGTARGGAARRSRPSAAASATRSAALGKVFSRERDRAVRQDRDELKGRLLGSGAAALGDRHRGRRRRHRRRPLVGPARAARRDQRVRRAVQPAAAAAARRWARCGRDLRGRSRPRSEAGGSGSTTRSSCRSPPRWSWSSCSSGSPRSISTSRACRRPGACRDRAGFDPTPARPCS